MCVCVFSYWRWNLQLLSHKQATILPFYRGGGSDAILSIDQKPRWTHSSYVSVSTPPHIHEWTIWLCFENTTLFRSMTMFNVIDSILQNIPPQNILMNLNNVMDTAVVVYSLVRLNSIQTWESYFLCKLGEIHKWNSLCIVI